jgi:hypothetical protein
MRELASKIDEPGKPKVVISCLNPGFCQTALVKPERTMDKDEADSATYGPLLVTAVAFCSRSVLMENLA